MEIVKGMVIGLGEEGVHNLSGIIPLCNLVTGAVGMNVNGVWGSSDKCKLQCKRWWPEIPWNDVSRWTND